MVTPRFADFDEQSLDRIIDAAKTKLPDQKLPNQFDRDALYDDLIGCYELYRRADSPAAVKNNASRLLGIRKHTSKLVLLLETDDSEDGALREFSEVLLPQLRVLIKCLLDEPQMQMAARDFPARIKERLKITGSPLQTLAGLWLPRVYRKHFRRAAGSSRPAGGGPPDGPYVRFARQVLAEWKIKGSAETIDAALGQHGKAPRKSF